MSVVDKESLLGRINTVFGENTSDEALSIIEDISDTFGDYDSRLADQTDYKKKYEDNDAEWRKKYRDRFMSGTDSPHNDDETDPPKQLRYEDLFK